MRQPLVLPTVDWSTASETVHYVLLCRLPNHALVTPEDAILVRNVLNNKVLLLLFAVVAIGIGCSQSDSPASINTSTPAQTPTPADTPTPVPTPSPTPTPTPAPRTQRIILIQGVCSASSVPTVPVHWTNIIKNILVDDYGMIDLPTGDPNDQVIEFGYSLDGWDQPYLPADTLKSVSASSESLRDIYTAYAHSEFFILGHSLGGVVALDGLARYGTAENAMLDNTSGIITVSSPVRGLVDRTASAAGAAIELVACRQLPQLDGSSQVWADLASSGASTSLIHGHDWSELRVVNFGNEKDRVVDVETAVMPGLFEVSCYDEGREGFLELNHDTLLNQSTVARELLRVLIDGDRPVTGCIF